MFIHLVTYEKPPKPVKVTYVSAAKAAKKLGITSRRLRVLAGQGRIKGAKFDEAKGWLIPKNDIVVSPGARGPKLTLKLPA